MTTAPRLEPYRWLFPLGIAYAWMGVLLWPLQMSGGIADASAPHRALMMLGFEQAFILGFLLTAMPGLTHGDPCRPWELALAVASMLAVGPAILLGHALAAAVAAALAMVVVAVALLRRVATGRARPPEEFVFVALALVAGLASALLRLAEAGDMAPALPPRFTGRLFSLGMVLPLVLGLGSLLVPAFAGFRDPLVIRGVDGPDARRGRRMLYLLTASMLAGAFAADLAGHRQLGYGMRALPAWALVVLAWRPWRRGTAATSSMGLRIAGPLAALGMTVAAVSGRYETAGLHITFIGGFALLTMAVGTRVVVTHGKHPLALEMTLLSSWVLLGMMTALALRLVAEWFPGGYPAWLVASAAAWLVTWTAWGLRVLAVLRSPARGVRDAESASPR